MGNDASTGLIRRRCSEFDVVLPHWLLRHHNNNNNKQRILGILSFETAKTMSRLLSLYKSLTDREVSRLRNESVTTEGVAYLISTDHHFLLTLACREKMEDLDRIAIAVARLGKHCSGPVLTQFGRFYDVRLANYKDADRMFRKLEKFVSTTADLYSGLQSLTELEISDKRMKKWSFDNTAGSPNFDLFDQKLSWQKQRVRHLRRVSLWNQNFDRVVPLMARAVCVVYARILVVFASHVPPLMLSTTLLYPQASSSSSNQHHQLAKLWADCCSANNDYLSQTKSQHDHHQVSNLSNKQHVNNNNSNNNNVATRTTTRLLNQLPASTVGGSGLPLGYANVVIMAERYLMSNCASIDKREREELYHMLPESLKRLVRSKLKEMVRRREDDFGDADIEWVLLGWEEEARAILRWLGPMAHHTLTWQTERNVEKQTFDVKPRVLLLQTLFFADKDKTDDAIADLLGSLSCICKYQKLFHSN